MILRIFAGSKKRGDMGVLKKVVVMATAVTCMVALAQDISMEEMELLDQWRTHYSAKGIQLKPEDEVRMLQRVRLMKLMASGGGQGAASLVQMLQQQQQQRAQPQVVTTEAQNVALGAMSEQDLRKQLDDLPAGKQLTSFSYMRDGLTFNGQRYADSTGKAERFAIDPESATVAYLVPMGNIANVKIGRLGTGNDPITIGRLTKEDNRFVFQSVTGKRLVGDLFFPMTDGALLVRDSVGFRYTVGEGVKQIDFPSGWSPTSLQRGNASTTGWLLLERDTADEKKNPFAALKSIGEMAGALPARMDYALFNLASRGLLPFEVSTEGKSVASYSQCRRASNGLANVCEKMHTYDSIWRSDGTANTTHYFWTIDWQKMRGRPIAVVMEKGLQEVNGYDLSGTKRVNLLQRTMGINRWTMELSDNGKYRISAQLAFEKSVVEDVAAEIQNSADAPRKRL